MQLTLVGKSHRGRRLSPRRENESSPVSPWGRAAAPEPGSAAGSLAAGAWRRPRRRRPGSQHPSARRRRGSGRFPSSPGSSRNTGLTTGGTSGAQRGEKENTSLLCRHRKRCTNKHQILQPSNVGTSLTHKSFTKTCLTRLTSGDATAAFSHFSKLKTSGQILFSTSEEETWAHYPSDSNKMSWALRCLAQVKVG